MSIILIQYTGIKSIHNFVTSYCVGNIIIVQTEMPKLLRLSQTRFSKILCYRDVFNLLLMLQYLIISMFSQSESIVYAIRKFMLSHLENGAAYKR